MRAARCCFPIRRLAVGVERDEFFFDQQDVRLELFIDRSETMIRNQKERCLIEYARLARRFDDAANIFVHLLGCFKSFGRARPVCVMRAVKREQMN